MNRHFWHVCRNTPNYDPRYDNIWQQEFGVPADLPARPAEPPLVEQVWNFAKAMKDFVADGLQTVSSDEYAARLAVCEECNQRVENRCLLCGCYLSLKARGRAFTCPLEKWPQNLSRNESNIT